MRIIASLVLSIFIITYSYAQKTINYKNQSYHIGVSSKDDTFSILSKDYIQIDIEYTYLTIIKEENIPAIYNDFGSNYDKAICLPVIRSTARNVFGKYTVTEIFGVKRNEYLNELSEISRIELKEYHIDLLNVMVIKLIPPATIKAAMEKRVLTEQIIMIQENELRISKLKAEKRKVDAENTAN